MTGHGLKDTSAFGRLIEVPPPVRVTDKGVAQALSYVNTREKNSHGESERIVAEETEYQ